MPIFTAVLFDILLGDPPNRFHPTAWMGSLIGFLKRFRPYGNRFAEFTHGLFIVFLGCGLAAGIGWLILVLTSFLPTWFAVLIHGLFLSLTISLRGLEHAAKEVQAALAGQNLTEGRRLLSWHLVSRTSSHLNESQVSAAAIESVAENASDGIIAPLFFYVFGGLPAAFAYRFANTADSMLGYRDVEHEWLGKFPARFDDVLNFIPARLTGLFIVFSAPFCQASLVQAWNIMWRDSHKTTSPNAGVPMSAMAGALGVELEKVDHYRLGQGLRSPSIHNLLCARRLLYVSVWMAALIFTGLSLYVRSR